MTQAILNTNIIRAHWAFSTAFNIEGSYLHCEMPENLVTKGQNVSTASKDKTLGNRMAGIVISNQ